MFTYFWERETAWAVEGQRERGDTESEAGSRLWAVNTEPSAGLTPMNCEIVTWAKVIHLTDWDTQVPPNQVLVMYLAWFCTESNALNTVQCLPDLDIHFTCLSHSQVLFVPDANFPSSTLRLSSSSPGATVSPSSSDAEYDKLPVCMSFVN